MSNPPRPKPRLDQENTPFWTGGAEGKLNIIKCGDCGQYTHPPKVLCRHCQSENIAPEAVAGTGVVDTFTINYQPWAKGLEVPYVIARVALDGVPGVYLTTNIVNCPVDAVDFGDRVCVTFEEQDGIFYPLFEKQKQNQAEGAN
ncbi:Zn-ribbon domain-containing OB-fold protein [Novosphingobium malaysiense]|uniref:DNA-binding protein n=1 Tax=Novosphingobium malaysiense TaxID=1348853 RepID=A0A0B1ZRC9_9SPHN|nr:OB-fold domain-containing protein [Novosphingobium malaysiense]KHK91844.1 DNA-binding protein [Novosphingobium malaysiense]